MSGVARLVRGVGWGAGSSVVVAVLQLFLVAVMARLLDPRDFGLVAMASLALRFFGYFAQMGVTPALIQKPELGQGDVKAALAVSLGLASLCAALVIATAPAVQAVFAMPGLRQVIQVLAVNFLVGGASAVSSGLMRRAGRFREIAMIDAASYAVGYGVVGLLAARMHWGVWALVLAMLTQSMVGAISGYVCTRYPLSVVHLRAERRHFLGFGTRYSLIGFIEFLAANLDALVIGKLLGSQTLGIYNRAIVLANMPVQQPANILTGVLFPMMSSVSDQRTKLSMGFQLGSILVGCYACAVGFGMALAAADIVAVVLGPKWLAAVPAFCILSCAMGPAYVSHVAGVTLDAMGELPIKLKVQASALALMMFMLGVAAYDGSLVAIARAVLITEWVRVVALGVVVSRRLEVGQKDAFVSLGCIGIAALCSIACISLARFCAGSAGAVGWRLALEVVAGAGGLALASFVARGLAARNSAVIQLAQRAPAVARFLPAHA